MKNVLLIMTVMLLCITKTTLAQQWLTKLPDKPREELTFFDYQNAFNSYWEPFNVVNGYYILNGEEKKAVGWKQFKRWEYHMKSIVNMQTGEFPNKTAAQVAKEFYENDPPEPSGLSSNWTSLGSGTSSGGYNGIGRVNCIAFHPNNSNEIWAGSAGGGLWHSTDNGNSWTPLTDQIEILSISDVLIPSDYITSNTIYIATGDKDQAWNNGGSTGVLKSTNGGITWNTTGLVYSASNMTSIFKLLINPTNNQEILAATSNGVYKTTNGGTTWSLLSSNLFVDMEYKPGTTNTIYGSTNTGRIYLSTNSGSSWPQVYSNNNAGRIELAVSPNQSTWVYGIEARNDETLEGIVKSTNSGTSFTQIFSGNTKNMLGYDSNGGDYEGQANYDLSIAVSPSNANTVIIGGVNTWRSTNGGTQWSIVSYWSTYNSPVQTVHADKHCHIFRQNGDLFEGNDGGIYISTNNGTSWTDKTNGMVIGQLYRLGTSKTNSTITITGLQDNGSKLLNTGVWSQATGGDGMECIVSHFNSSTQYATYTNGTLYRTTNLWGSKSTITPSGAGQGAWVTPYIMDPNDSQILYAGYSNVWKSTNGGTSWSQISTMSSSYKLESIAQAPTNTQVIYTADAYNMWKTTNGGSSWSTINFPYTSGAITYICVKNNDPNTVWVTAGGYDGNTIFQSTNGGSTWTNIAGSLPDIPVLTIIQNNLSITELQLFIGTESGVYVKTGTGNWIPHNTNFPNVRVCELEIYYATNPLDSRLRAATYGRGLWETPIDFPSSAQSGTVTANTTICTGQTATLNVSGYYGSIQWQQSTDGTTWTNVVGVTGGNSDTYTTALLSQTTHYRVVTTYNSTTATSNSVIVTVGVGLNLPLSEGFEGAFAPTDWTISNVNGDYTWESVNVGSSSSKSTRVQNYNISQVGRIDELILPSYSFVGVSNPTLTFDLSYARYSSSYIDSLIVLVSSNCGASWQRVYQKGNTTLATTADYSAGMFVPSSQNQWRMETVDLTAYSGQANVIVKFRDRSGYGQPVYIDNINIQNLASSIASLTISSSDNNNSICAGDQVTFTAIPTNGGSSPSYQWQVNGSNVGTNSVTFTTNSLTTGQSVTCIMTSNLSGVTSSPTTSYAISTTVNAIPSTPVISTNSPVCSGYSINLSTSTVVNTTYAWSGPNSFSSTAQNPTISGSTVAMSGTYNLIVTANGCSSTAGSTSVIVNPSLISNVSIALTAGTNPTCASSPVTFTATPTNGGTMPSYQWKINGVNAGTNSATLTPVSLVNNDVITCVLTSNEPCAYIATAESNAITMSVTSFVVPSVSIVANSNPACTNSNVTFTVSSTNGGSSPSYQWILNGSNVGTNSPIYNTVTTNNDVVTCIMTSNSICASTPTATSNAITMMVTSTATPSVAIALTSGTNPSCAGSALTFTATPTNDGTTLTYQWKVNGANVGTNNPTYASTTFANNDVITCVMTSNSPCATTATVTSNAITVSITNSSTPSLVISPSSNPACAGTIVTFTTAITNGGANPTFVWNLNGGPVGTGTTYSSSFLTSLDVVSCTMLSNATCLTTQTANSNNIAMTVNSPTTPAISTTITSGENPSCQGSNISFAASATNGGISPTYQWQINGVNVGTNSVTFSSTSLMNNDIVTCILISNAGCVSTPTAASTGIAMIVNPIPTTPIISVLAGGTTLTSSSPTGNQWYFNGMLIMGATQQTLIATQNGNYTVIVSNGTCSSAPSSISLVSTVGVNEESAVGTKFSVYPNPSTGIFTVTFTSAEIVQYKLELRNVIGQIIYEEELKDFNGTYTKDFDITDYEKGEYFIVITDFDNHRLEKLVVY